MHYFRPLEDWHVVLVTLEFGTVAQHRHTGQRHPGGVTAAVSGI